MLNFSFIYVLEAMTRVTLDTEVHRNPILKR